MLTWLSVCCHLLPEQVHTSPRLLPASSPPTHASADITGPNDVPAETETDEEEFFTAPSGPGDVAAPEKVREYVGYEWASCSI